MGYKRSDITVGLVELTEDVSHDPDEQDWFDVHEYLDDIPNPRTVLKELIHLMHEDYL